VNDLLVRGGEFSDQEFSLSRSQPLNSSVVVGKTGVRHFERLTLISLALNICLI